MVFLLKQKQMLHVKQYLTKGGLLSRAALRLLKEEHDGIPAATGP